MALAITQENAEMLQNQGQITEPKQGEQRPCSSTVVFERQETALFFAGRMTTVGISLCHSHSTLHLQSHPRIPPDCPSLMTFTDLLLPSQSVWAHSWKHGMKLTQDKLSIDKFYLKTCCSEHSRCGACWTCWDVHDCWLVPETTS